MRTIADALASASFALSQLGLPEELSAVHAAGIHIEGFILGGSHSVVTYPPLNALQLVEPAPFQTPGYGDRVNLYLHIPFCETKCSFCHYLVQLYRGKQHSTATM